MKRMVEHIRRLLPRFVGSYARWAIGFCLQTAYCLFLLGSAIHLLQPYMADYAAVYACEKAAFENIPAVLVCGALAAIAGELIARQSRD